MAARFKDEPRFFFPYQLDFRGRIYAVPSYLTPQGTDLAKGLLRFAEGKPLGTMQAVRWLAIHGSNCFGNDKVSLDDRHSWVLQHQQEILECAEDPFSHAWWHEADEPFCFLAFCLEWAGYVREGLDFVSHIPVAMDGTCNGLQIFSLILRDKVGGSAVNLLPAARPQDIYQIVADKVIGKLKTDAADPDKDSIVTTKKGKAFYSPAKSAAILLDMGINRKTTKRQVMVLPYVTSGMVNERDPEKILKWGQDFRKQYTEQAGIKGEGKDMDQLDIAEHYTAYTTTSLDNLLGKHNRDVESQNANLLEQQMFHLRHPRRKDEPPHERLQRTHPG